MKKVISLEKITYSIENLKEVFPDLEPNCKYELIPLMNLLFQKFIDRLKTPLGRIDDIFEDKRNQNNKYARYFLSINNNIVEMIASYQNIDQDPDNFWPMVSEISFYGFNKHKLNNAYKQLVFFIEKEHDKLDDLIQETADMLKEGYTFYLSNEIKEFYSLN